jgi:hypothetical protein
VLFRSDKIDGFKGNLHTAFGTAMHSVCELGLLDENLDRGKHFLEEFEKEVASLKKKEVEIQPDLYEQMVGQYEPIVSSFRDELDNYFEDCEVVSTEEKLYEDIEGHDLKFKGFIDLVIATKDGKIHLIDWKTCSGGWDARKKSDTELAYQLVYYKHFYARKHPEVSVEDVETHFVLFKRTAKAGKKIEFIRVTAGKKRIENALNTLVKALHNIEEKRYTQNRLACTKCPDRFGTCEFYQTEHCK